MDDRRIYCTVATAAFNLGIGTRAMYNWLNNHEVKKQGNLIDFTEVLFLRREQNEQQIKDLTDAETKLKAEAKIKKEKAKQEELKTNELMGKIIYVNDVETALTTLFTDMRQLLLTIPENIEQQTMLINSDVAGDVKEIASAIVNKALVRLATENITK